MVFAVFEEGILIVRRFFIEESLFLGGEKLYRNLGVFS